MSFLQKTPGGKTGWFLKSCLEFSTGSNEVTGSLLKSTGAEANVLHEKHYAKACKTQTVLSAYGVLKLQQLGCISTKIRDTYVELYVVETDSEPILGLKSCHDLKLIARLESVMEEKPLTRNDAMKEYKHVFKGLEKFEGTYKTELDPSIKPVVHPPRKVPFSLQRKLKETLDRMEAEGSITPAEEPTDWVNSLVIVEKRNDSLQLCLDPCDLNTAIRREHYKISAPEYVAAQLHGKKFFTTLNEKDGYWQVQLDHESSLLCTFNTPYARYRFLKMPLGICSASEVFQKRSKQVFGDVKGVCIIADDMIIAAETPEEHDRIVRRVLEKAREQNVKFNPTKMQFKVDTVEYMGNVITPEGLKPDERKVRAISDMLTPTDKPALQRL
ncbi:PREDICTED: uncharacterized protein K02A2.6-like [Priapulus caudatus]|uniref:Uncharacterized protein K02A2.6-like n=1 Tax=Priapulus caudatus TaxID=37621 RepID=A0ABM1ESZ4_PRICU|nr:PREDICTED: uncharacterized protein K02A2.6-like [Priapulus caudatus]